MNEIIESLAALLERGIIIEPYGASWPSDGPAFRIRLNDEDDNEKQSEQQGMGW